MSEKFVERSGRTASHHLHGAHDIPKPHHDVDFGDNLLHPADGVPGISMMEPEVNSPVRDADWEEAHPKRRPVKEILHSPDMRHPSIHPLHTPRGD